MATLCSAQLLPLHTAAEENDLEKLEQLLLDGYSYTVNHQDKHGRTALHCLLNSKTFSELNKVKQGIQCLLDSGAELNIQNKHGETPLHTVIQSYLEFIPEIIRYLLTHTKSYVMETPNEDGYSFFHLFMSDFNDYVKEKENYQELLQEKEEFIHSLLRGEILKCDCCALLNQKVRSGYSAFYTYIGNSDCFAGTIELMISCGADVNTFSLMGTTPLMESVLRRRTEIVEILLKAGANPNEKDIFGQTCVFRVFTNDCFDLLKQFDADFCVKDKFGRSPITNIALYTPEDLPQSNIVILQKFSSYPPLFEKFLEAGVSCNEVDNHGSSVLHYAAWYGDTTAVKELVQHGADLDTVDSNGYSPLDLAVHVGNSHVYEFLSKSYEKDTQAEYETKYCGLVINQADTNNMKKVLTECLGIKDDPACLLSSLVSSPRLGMTELRPESRQITSEMFNLMQKIASVVGKLNPLFSCTVYPTGSSSEGTKIGDPDEFDYLFCLDNFSKYCVPYQDDDILNSGFVRMKIESHEGITKFQPYLEGTTLSADLVRDTFQDLVTCALSTPGIWTSEYLYFDGLVGYPSDKPIINLEIQWFERVMKRMAVSVDIVPGVVMQDWSPKESSDKQSTWSIDAKYLLMFHSPAYYEWNENDSKQLVRISSSLMDRLYLKSLPHICTESYAAAKILKSTNFLPKVQFDEDNLEMLDTEYKEQEESVLQCNSIQEAASVTPNQGDDKPCNAHLYNKSLPSEDAGDHSEDLENEAQKSGSNRIVPWLVEMDESNNVRKIFTPKDKAKMESKNKVFIDENMGMKFKTSMFKNNKNKLIYFNPLAVEENPDDMDDGSATSEEEDTDEQSSDTQMPVDGDDIKEDSMSSGEMDDDSSDDFEWKGGDVMYASDNISSYMLKTCLFHVLHEEKNESGDIPSYTLLELTIKIYDKLFAFAKEGRLPSYFLPFVDVLTYVNTHIRMVPESELEVITKQQCEVIQVFCKVILGILRQDVEDCAISSED